MRTLETPPTTLTEAGSPRFGSFRGGLPRLDFGSVPRSRLWQLAHAKRWTYAAIADEHVIAAIAVVSLGYASTAIVFVLDRARGELCVDRSLLVPDGAVTFTDGGAGKRSVRFASGRVRVEVGDERILVDMPKSGSSPPVHISAEMSAASGGVAVGAVVPIEGGYANATEKRINDARGEIVAGGRRFLLRDPVVGLDHTFGYLARHTVWRWAFALGRASGGERLAFNLTEGFVGEPECAAWLGDELFALGEGRFTFDQTSPMEPWRLTTTCGAVDLTFRPAAIHAERKNLLVVRSEFMQPVGAFEGRITLGGREIRVDGLGGVTEHQDAVW